MKIAKLSIFFLFLTLVSKGQTFSFGGGGIPDNQTPIYFPMAIAGLSQTAMDSTFGIESVCINITHTYDSDLEIYLIAPDSTFIELTTGNGGSGNHYLGTCFNDLATTSIWASNPPFNGSYKPETPLNLAHNGQNPNGIWYLYIYDNTPTDSGNLISFNITFGTNIGQPFTFPSSNLPLIKINTFGQTIRDDPKVNAWMQIIDNGVGNRNFVNDTNYAFEGKIGIEIRGSSSQMFPKKSFGIETRDSLDNDIDTSLLGMPAESDWILNANYSDKTLLRNALAYEIARGMGNYASRVKHCEVFLNGVYQGVYVFLEKVKRNENRVDISKLSTQDTSGSAVTGGYILKVDKTTGSSSANWNSVYQGPNGGTKPLIQIEYPSVDDLQPSQFQYIKSFADSFEIALKGTQFTSPTWGYARFINDTSFIDFFLSNEISKNIDGYRISSFLHKKKDTKNNLLYAGPVWDYDIAWGNADYLNAQYITGWSYNFNSPSAGQQVPFWWSRLLADPIYTGKLQCRYDQLRSTILSTANVHAYIDSMALYLQEGQDRNFQAWPIIGTYVWPNPNPIATSYAGEIANLKTWISSRFTWLDLSMPGTCSPSGLNELLSSKEMALYPNPASNLITINFIEEPMNEIFISTINGQQILHLDHINNFQHTIDVRTLSSGMYFITCKGNSIQSTKKFIKQ